MLVRAEHSVLIIIDLQEKLLPAVKESATTLQNASLLLTAAQACRVPVMISEQYPEGLGKTATVIADAAGDAPVFSKVHFSCMKDARFREAFVQLDRKQAVLAGTESHVCVAQTAVSLIELGYEVFFVADATTSRSLESKSIAQMRLSAAGAQIVNTEMVVFEWLGKADTPEFKSLLPLIKG